MSRVADSPGQSGLCPAHSLVTTCPLPVTPDRGWWDSFIDWCNLHNTRTHWFNRCFTKDFRSRMLSYVQCFLSLSHRLFGWLVPRSVKSYQTKFSAKRDVNGTLFKLRGTDSKLCRRLCYISNSMKINYRCKENFEQKDERKRQFPRIFRYAKPDSWDGM